MARLHGHILEPVEHPATPVKDTPAQGDSIEDYIYFCAKD